MTSTRLLPIEQNTDLVTYQLRVNGEQLPLTIPVFSIEVCHEINRIPTACIRISDGDSAAGEWPISSGDFFVPGNAIEILVGYHSEDTVIFSGIVTKQALSVRSQRLILEVECKNKAVQMTATRKSRQLAEVTDSDVVNMILDEYKLTGDVESTDVIHQHMVQYDCSDWDFVVSRIEANGQVLAIANEGINVFKPTTDGDVIATLQFGANIIEFDAEIDARMQYAAVIAQAWSAANQENTIAEAADPEWTTVGNLAPADLAAATGRAQVTIRHSGNLNEDEAQAWADSTLLRSRMSFIRGRARIEGLSIAEPGIMMELVGFSNRFNGPVWISSVRHEIAQGNWLTDVQFGLHGATHTEYHAIQSPGAAGLLAGVAGLHTGEVAALEGDPEGEGRIQVKIPSVSLEEEGIWCRIATLDAGSKRGTFFMPEIMDEVVVGFLNDDPRHAIVLGMLHSSAKPAPLEASDANPKKGYVSKSGMRIEFDDETSIMLLSTPAGKSVALDDQAGVIFISDEHGNALELSSKGIALTSDGDIEIKASGNINFEGGINLEAKAGAQYKAEGSAGAEVSSSGVTVIKGSLVQIN